MDVSAALIAKSSQLNAVDLVGSEQTVTILEVSQGSAEQPVNIITDIFGPGRPFKPSKTVLRLLAKAWGLETANWVGHSMTIFRDPSVRWAGEEVGGIRVSALSHIDKAFAISLPVSKTKHASYSIKRLEVAKSSPARDWPAAIKAAEGNVQALITLRDEATRAHAGDAVLSAISVAGKKAQEAGQ
ncbi:hypothetical protein [Rathayibacter sp. VKM Ac-2630]|uniref:hypothetical protein n=1 Tax=Rathayibacter sp. VKM Ac-2630 TaxID=1938617 RepID=UPI000982078D|nr:hypothetical protein [Rathayibacter sp. VKM Ac-2630]OOB91213.1 hypothetical protein B0T42_07395 [Rathayibacter sp. VKM Ac-2630]